VRAVVQVVDGAHVTVDGAEVARVEGAGLLVLLGITHSDSTARADGLAAKVWRLRIMDGEQSASDLGAPILVVSQFTLYADTSRGRRPGWSAAASSPVAQTLVEEFCCKLRDLGAQVQTGSFGAHMRVALVNDGPRTILLEA
jgi:D-aminoacyl-tRNA deacylase